MASAIAKPSYSIYRLHFSSSLMSCRFQSKEKLPMSKESLDEDALAPQHHYHTLQIVMTAERELMSAYRSMLNLS